ncbi:hypothetical protein GCM10027031_04360 [Corynebacterium atrinae]
MIGDGTGEENPITRLNPVESQVTGVGDLAYPGGGDVDPIAGAARDNLGVTGGDDYSRLLGGSCHRGDHPAQHGDL